MITWAHNTRDLVSLSDTICFSISSCQCGPKIDIWRCRPEVKILIGITGRRCHRDARRVVGIDSQSIWYSEALLSLLFGEHKIDAVRFAPMQQKNRWRRESKNGMSWRLKHLALSRDSSLLTTSSILVQTARLAIDR